jgi:hypothetical protein
MRLCVSVDLDDLNSPAFNLARRNDSSGGNSPGRRHAAIPEVAHFDSNSLPRRSSSLRGWLRNLCNFVGPLSITDTIGNAVPFDIHDNLGSMTDLNDDHMVNRRGDKGKLNTSPLSWDRNRGNRSLNSLINVICERRLFAVLVFVITFDIVNFGF